MLIRYPTQGNDCLVDTEKQCIKMHICFRLYVIGKTNTDRQTYIWIDINGEVKVAVILSKIVFFPVANFFKHMFSVSLTNLQSIRTFHQKLLRVKLMSSCMHHLSCTKAAVLTKIVFQHHTSSCTYSVCL